MQAELAGGIQDGKIVTLTGEPDTWQEVIPGHACGQPPVRASYRRTSRKSALGLVVYELDAPGE
jgi:hypothetical protein